LLVRAGDIPSRCAALIKDSSVATAQNVRIPVIVSIHYQYHVYKQTPTHLFITEMLFAIL